MAKIREDLIGAVHVDGHVLLAGDTVPKGVKVGPHLTGAEPKTEDKTEPAKDAPKPKRGRPRKTPVEDTGDAEVD